MVVEQSSVVIVVVLSLIYSCTFASVKSLNSIIAIANVVIENQSCFIVSIFQQKQTTTTAYKFTLYIYERSYICD